LALGEKRFRIVITGRTNDVTLIDDVTLIGAAP
jgi:hypothetical protein